MIGDDGAANTDESKSKREKTRVSIRVDSKVRDVEHGNAKPTGQFHYTFVVDKDVRVMPESYQEHMIYLDGRRRSQQVTAELDIESQHSSSDASEAKTLHDLKHAPVGS